MLLVKNQTSFLVNISINRELTTDSEKQSCIFQRYPRVEFHRDLSIGTPSLSARISRIRDDWQKLRIVSLVCASVGYST